jgi:hypothetical protein
MQQGLVSRLHRHWQSKVCRHRDPNSHKGKKMPKQWALSKHQTFPNTIQTTLEASGSNLPMFEKRLMFEWLSQMQHPSFHGYNNAKGCLDRIVHLVAGICAQRLIMPKGSLIVCLLCCQIWTTMLDICCRVSKVCFNATEVNPVTIQG